MKYFLSSLPKNILKCFTGRNLVWQIIAIGTTYVLVVTNIDWYYFVHTRLITLIYIFSPAMILGGIIPIVIPPYTIIGGYLTKTNQVRILGWAIGQAAFIGFIISSFYKIFTGRIQPSFFDTANNISKNFEFGFLRHGIFWGWPSSHTTIAFAMAFTLIYLFPKNKIVKILSFLYAIYIGIGVSLSIHWLSDFVAGTIMGSVIGITVAFAYRKELI